MSKDFKTYQLDELYPIAEGSRHILIGCRRDDYSASRIAAAVEDCDAHLLNLNVMTDDSGHHDIIADIRVNRLTVGALVRSLERYGFDVIAFDGQDDSDGVDDTLKERVEELLRYINM